MRSRPVLTRVCVAAALAAALAASARAEGEPESSGTSGVAWTVLAYLPNRLFDLCDVFRVHARVGHGFAAGARVTRFLPAFVGEYGALWVGLPGPRGRDSVPVPIGIEVQSGVEVGPARLGRATRAPVYGVGEVGVGGMLWIVGAEVGVDVYELADFVAGLALVDLADDDF